ncbi:response regulator [Janthinobacterium sp. 17J80-10]|uniref:response regulator n=1 Tax=Janthinobacterium sp. 17J80-10 TaxID=2497863 RepID=UPI0010056863|nr:response regulator [Janthinobacterium sp. 17J80-10]QAU34394.1 response regulator [Janthinobacterium sp. 17J80-10]
MPNFELPDWSSKTYLVIDDFSIVHRMLRDMLRKLGARTVDTVKNGADAIAQLRAKRYDVVLCDYNFSEGPNGQQILEEARHRDLVGLTCIWIMVSSEKAVETVMGAAEMAPDGYILKPLTDSLLLARLNRAWDRKQSFTAIERAYAARDYLQAAALCDQTLARAPVHAMDLLRMKASLLLKANQVPAARQVYEQALAMREQVWAKAGLARIDRLEGHHAAAKNRLREIVRDYPSYLDAHDMLAQTLQQLGETAEALAVLQQAARLSPHSVMRQQSLGDIASQLGATDIAEQAYRTSIAVGEYSVMKSPDAHLGLARLHGKNGRLQAALDLLAEARQNFPGAEVERRAKLAESQAYADAGQADKAVPPPSLPAVAASAAVAAVPATAILAPVQVLHRRAEALIRYMETNGYNGVSADEARAVLARAEKLAPGAERTPVLLATLVALASGRN